ncbi:HEAT repeat domain-containing protein [Streptomyces sp. YS415]|uniref:HEAT repeat domain-containing protein n=1 Tax=Streptomyces sp. YS415 TaxID=2944806 RepID=UPI0020215DFD|nr:HEAT repeat domain-containing protein [Streptomyces sp. YS415]MCL7429174.1 HEAT repeat domain-containing protein [Streptomyces sp. YS415]
MERAASISDVMRMRMEGEVAGLCRATWSENHDAAVYATAMLGSAVRTPEVVRTLHLCLKRGDEPLPGLHWHALASLGRLRVERAVPLLLRTLAESDHNRRQLDKVACEALLAIGGPEVVRGLVDLCERLPSGRGYWTVRVLDALAALRASQAVTPLLATLWGYLPDLAVRVVRTLGAIGDPRAASALLVLAHSPALDTHLRRAAVEALHALPAVGWPPPHRHPAVERLLHTPQRDPDPDTARLATALLARTEDGRAHLWEVLRGAAEQGGPDCPPHAVAAVCAHIAAEPGLFAVPDHREHHALLAHLLRAAAAPAVRRAAAGALAASAGAGAAGALVAALDDAHIGDTVADLVAALPESVLSELVDQFTRPGGSVARRRGVARVLGLAGRTDAAPVLLSALADDTTPVGVRASAAGALGALRHAAAAPLLAALARDEEQPGTLRAHAVRALGSIGVPDTLPVVLACTRSPHEAVRRRAVVALGAFPVSEAARALETFVTPGAEPDLACAAVQALRKFGGPALPVLVRLAADADGLPEDVGHRLVEALAAHPGAEATGALLGLATAPPPDPRDESTYAISGERRLSRSTPAREVASLALVERGSARDLTPLTALLGPDTWFGAHEPAVQALLRIGTEEAYEHVLAFCSGTKHFDTWHVGALDAVAAARGIRLGS